jgi:hypothetical protein
MITVPIDQALAVILLENYSTAFTREWKILPEVQSNLLQIRKKLSHRATRLGIRAQVPYAGQKELYTDC